MGIPISERGLLQPGLESVVVINAYWIGFVLVILIFSGTIHLLEWLDKKLKKKEPSRKFNSGGLWGGPFKEHRDGLD